MSRFSLIKMMSSLIVLLSLFIWDRQADAFVVSLVENNSDKELVISSDFQPLTNAEPGRTVVSDSFILSNKLDQPVKFYLEPFLVLGNELENKVSFSVERLSASKEMIEEKSNGTQELVVKKNGQEEFQLSISFEGDLLKNDSQNKKSKLLIKIIAQEMTTGTPISVDKSGSEIIGYTKNLPRTNEENKTFTFFLGIILIFLGIGLITKRKHWFGSNERR